MYLTSEEQSDLVYSSAEIHRIDCGERRWSEAAISTVRKDNKLYRIVWDRGLTENQEDEFTDGEVPEVFEVHELKVKDKLFYLTDEEREKESPTLANKLIADAESYEIVTGKQMGESITSEITERAKALLEVLPELASLDIASGAGSYRAATVQYLEAIIALAAQEDENR